MKAKVQRTLVGLLCRPVVAEGAGLAAILALAACLRMANLASNPPGVFRDEAEKALNGWALAKRGAAFELAPDSSGRPSVQWKRHPLFINVWGVETSAIYQYALAPLARGEAPPSPGVFRLPAALAGVAAVGALYGAARLAYGVPVGLGAAFWLAVSPWHIAFTRWALQGAFIPLFMTLGMGGLALGLRRAAGWLVLGGAGLGLAFYTYSGARPFILAFVVAAGVLRWREFASPPRRRQALGAAGVFVVLAAPAVAAMMGPGGAARFARISVFGEGRTFVEAVGAIGSNYLVHFSPSFLLLRGDPQLRHGVRSCGELGYVEFVFALAGLWALWKARGPERLLGAAWLALFPVGAALTSPSEMPHALRTLVVLPLPQILAGQGLAWFGRLLVGDRPNDGGADRAARLRVRVAWIAVGLATAVSVAAFAFDLFVAYPRYSAAAWETGFGQALACARQRADAGAPVVISGYIALAPYLTLYYDRVSPDRLAAEGWGAVRAEFPPLEPDLDLRGLWGGLPRGATLICLPAERVGAYPIKIVHPPGRTAAESEAQPPTYVVYKRN